MLDGFTISDFAAWWGAIVATCVLAWEVYTWQHSRPKVEIDLHCILLENCGDNKQRVSLSIMLRNTGGRKLVVTHVKARMAHRFARKNNESISFDIAHKTRFPVELECSNRCEVLLRPEGGKISSLFEQGLVVELKHTLKNATVRRFFNANHVKERLRQRNV